MTERSGQSDRRPPVGILRKIDEICARFEEQWIENKQRRIEDLQYDIDQQWCSYLLTELISLEVDLRFRSGEGLHRAEYQQRFPDHAIAIESAFDRLSSPDEISTPNEVPSGQLERESNGQRRTTEPNEPIPFEFDDIPRSINGYVIDGEPIGTGSFGVVFRATDTKKHQPVALKFPRNGRFECQQEVEEFCKEGLAAQRLVHPGIVQTYEVCCEQNYVFIVQQLVDGQNLKSFAKKGLLQEDVAGLVASVADAIAHAHRNGVYHRDLKPSNILVDGNDSPLVTDFGVAILESAQRRHRGERAGTPAYMSPEIVRGESHFIDGRSDIWSLGVILYELLTGRRPFLDKQKADLFDEIKYREPIPLRQIDQSISPELERICLRCLSKRSRDRYLTGNDLANDLREWVERPLPTTVADDELIVPRGLRSYGPDDSAAFAQLLPGPRDRHGDPESIRFWRTRIESSLPSKTFPVGFVYGPSGAGKSSFVKAGLLPRLANNVIPIYVECTGNDTEVRVLKALRKQIDGIPNNLSLPELFDLLSDGTWIQGNNKVLLVLDQFEQWLHTNRPTLESQLTLALRHCDGRKLQSMVLVRDDFWLAVSRFKQALEVDLVDGENSMLIDRFEMQHAKNVLKKYGRAYGKLPLVDNELSRDQKQFLEKAVSGLAENRQVICVRLSLLAEMFKKREWTKSELRNVGGTTGLGEKFLDEVFSAKHAAMKYNQHETAARAVLEALLPKSGVAIRGHMRSYQQLLDASTYGDQTNEFTELVEILDKELRLITPTDPDAPELFKSDKEKRLTAKYYQLTHDYLVPSIRNWLIRKKKATWRGRAELALADLEERYERDQESIPIVGPIELLKILLAVPKFSRSDNAQKILNAAKRRYSAMVVALILTLTIATWLAVTLTSQQKARHLALEQLLSSDSIDVPAKIENLRKYKDLVGDQLAELQASGERRKIIRSAAAVVALSDKFQSESAAPLLDALETATPAEFGTIFYALNRHPTESIELLHQHVGEPDPNAFQPQIVAMDLALGSSAIVEMLCPERTTPDAQTELPDVQTEFMLNYGRYANDLFSVAEVIGNTENSLTAYTMIIALGQLGDRIQSYDGYAEVVELVQDVYQTHKHGGVHFACEWTLRQWNVELPELPIDRIEPKDRSWWRIPVLGGHIDLVKVEPGSFRRRAGVDPGSERIDLPTEFVEMNDPFWMAVTEMPSWLVNQWKQNVNSPVGQSRVDTELPATDINFREIREFCQWLNRQVQNESLSHTFRIPTPDEWEYACRAGANTRFLWGNTGSVDVCNQFCVIADSAVQRSAKAQEIATRIPNYFGLYDISGNVWEICEFADDPEEEHRRLLLRGGAINGTRQFLVIGHFMDEEQMDRRSPVNGFRLIFD